MDTDERCAECEELQGLVEDLEDQVLELGKEVERLKQESDEQLSALDDIYDIAKKVL